MNSKRLYVTLVIVVGLLIAGLFGGAYAADTLLQAESKKLLDARAKSQSLEAQQTQLAVAKKEIEKYRTLGDTAKSIVPQDKDQAQAVREIVNLAASAGVKLGSITFPASTLGAAVPKPAASSGEGAAPTTPSPTPAPAPASGFNASQLKPVPGLSGVYSLDIQVQSEQQNAAAYSNFLKFLSGLENNRRTALVTGINLTPDSEDPSRVNFTLTISEYVKP